MLTNPTASPKSRRCSVTLILALGCAVLALAWPGWLTTLRAETYYNAIKVVAGQDQIGQSGATLAPFVVRLVQPEAGRPVVWTVPAGQGTFAGATTVTRRTDANGEAQVQLTLGSQPSVAVTATLEGGNTVVFSATCGNCIAVPPALADAAIAGLKQMSTLAPSAILAARTQATNIGLRLLNLRKGGAAISASGLSLNQDGEALPVGLAASQMFSLFGRGGGASADASPFGNIGVFANGIGSFGDLRSSSREPSFDFHTAGMTTGADYRVLPSLVLGAAFGYASVKNEFDGDAGQTTARAYSLSAYGGYTLGGFHADGIVTYGWNDYDTERNIAVPGGVVTAKGSPGGNQVAVSVNTGYDWSFGALTVGPSVRVNYVHVDVDRFSERGAGDFDLKVKSQTAESLTTSLGGEISYAVSVPFGVLTPLVRFEWEHEYKGGSRLTSGTLLTDPTQTLFSVRTDTPDRDYFNLGAGITGTFPGGWSTFLYYETILGRSRLTNHTLTLGVRFEF